MCKGSINHSINLSQSLQAVRDNVNKHRYATSKARLASQCHLLINLDLSNSHLSELVREPLTYICYDGDDGGNFRRVISCGSVDIRQVAAAPWWLPVEYADWRHPFGPDTDIEELYVCIISSAHKYLDRQWAGRSHSVPHGYYW